MTPDLPMRDITEGELREFEEHGVVCLAGLFQKTWVDRISTTLQAIADSPSTVLGRPVPAQAFIGDQYVWKLMDEFRDFVYLSPAARIAGAFMRSRCVRLFQDHLFIKPSGCDIATPWHHDQTFFPIRGGPLCSLWLALTDIGRENGGMEFIRGSHKWPQRFKAVRPDRLHYFLESDLEDVPDIDSMRDRYTIDRWDMRPGDALVFDSLTLHAAGANSAGTPRNAYATRWCNEGLTYEPRHATAQLRWKHGLSCGDKISGTLFPQILPHTVESEFGLRRFGPEPPDPTLTRLNNEAYAAAEERKRKRTTRRSESD